MLVVGREVIDDAGGARVQLAASELLGRDLLAGRRLHERRATEEDRALAAHDHGLVAHRRHVGAARRARAEHGSQLRDARRRHRRLVEEDAPEVLAVREHVVLEREEGAARVDQVEAWEPVAQRDLLRAQVLLDGHRVVGAALDRGVVRHHHDLAARHAPDPGDDPRARGVAVVEALRRERRQLEEGRPGVAQALDALARQQLAARDVTLTGALPASRRDALEALAQVGGEAAMLRLVDLELGRARPRVTRQHGHAGASSRGSTAASS